jgi:hypothetical protein
MRWFASRSLLGLLFAITLFITPAARGAERKQVRFTVDTARDLHPISPYIYGTNNYANADSDRPCDRLGGNRWTAYNWESNASNAGADWHHQNDGFLSESEVPGAAVRPAIEAAARNKAAIVVTIPMAGYVSADKTGDGDVNKTPDYLKTRFHVSLPKKNSPLSAKPDLADSFVYQDEFVHWIETSARASSEQVIFYSLDNEPDLWSHTHARIHPRKTTYAEMVERTTTYASAIKDVKPDALVFGAVNYGWNGYRTLQDAPDANGRDFHQYFLAEMKRAEAKAGRRLLDVLDVHWYPEARGGGVRITEKDASPKVAAARVQAPRSLWDPTYIETSWITTSSTGGKPIALIGRLKRDIADHYPGTKIAITEYNYGAGNHISGGIAQADVLGIFGREGIFAANWWNLGHGTDFIDPAFDLYLNYDGKGARFGDTSVFAATDDVESTAIYASIDSAGASRVWLVLINRTTEPIDATVSINHARPLASAELYHLTAEAAAVKPAVTLKLPAPNVLRHTLSPMSATTVKLTE